MKIYFSDDTIREERKRIKKLYKAVLSGKIKIDSLDYDDVSEIESRLGSELFSMGLKAHRYRIMAAQLDKRIARLEAISDAVASYRMLKEAEMVFDVFGDDAVSKIAPPKEADPPFCLWDVVDDRTLDLYFAVNRNEISLNKLDLADQWVVNSMYENRRKLSTFVAQIQSVIDAADEGKFHLNTLSYDDMRELEKAIDKIISD